ncbi:MAG: hypothetical protein RL544_295 [Bacteroidota bacterium]|jgi:hypothetical protein
MRLKKLSAIIFTFLLGSATSALAHSIHIQDTLRVNKVLPFEIDGAGTNASWNATNWVNLIQLDSSSLQYPSKFKILYADSGVYVLFSGLDKKITSPYKNDFEDLFRADVFEVFFHPEPSTPIYLEYEINAYNAELVLLVPNLSKKTFGWAPWKYTGKKKVVKKVKVHEQNNEMYKWTAELFFPFKLFMPLQNLDVKKGVCWNANFYRLDYDDTKMVKWAWSPIVKSFHEFEKYGVIQFN